MDKLMMIQSPRERKIERGLGLLHPNASLKVEHGGPHRDNEPRRRERKPLISFPSMHLRPVLQVSRKREMVTEFNLWSHSPAHVSVAIAHFLPTQENLQKLGISAIDRAFNLIRGYQELRLRPSIIPEDANLLTEYLRIFDALYFCGAIGANVYVEVAPRGVDGLEKFDYGDFCSHRRGSRWRPRADWHGRIRIANLAELKRFADPEKRLHHYLGTLLHEALHAVFELYVCYGHHACSMRERRYMGRDGHGWLFEELAMTLEDVTMELPNGGLSIV